MDRKPEELQFMGIFSIYKEAYKITVSWRRIFSQITLSLILPLSFIYLAEIGISGLIVTKIYGNLLNLDETQMGDPMYLKKIMQRIQSEMIALYIFKAVYLIFLTILSLLSTSAIVYTIACIYTSSKITFKKVISVVPKVWKRLMITLLWNFLIMFLYNLLAILVIFVFAMVLGVLMATGMIEIDPTKPKALMNLSLIFVIIFSIPYLIGVVYLSIVWQLANVISVLEETYGLNAMTKSKNLIKGKIWIASAIFVTLSIVTGVIVMVFNKLVVLGESVGMVGKVSLGILCLLLLAILSLYGLVIQTIIYFVCKSLHNENIDKSTLSDHLNVYHQAGYVPLNKDDTDMQADHFPV